MDATVLGAACPACGAHEVTPSSIDSAFWHDERLVVLEGVPALRCASCGEQFFDDNTVVRLDLLAGRGLDDSLARSHITVPVFSFLQATSG